MALSQQAAQTHAQRPTVEALQGGLLLLSSHRLEQQHLHIQHIQQVSQTPLSPQPSTPALLRQTVQVRQEVEARQKALRKRIQAQQEALRERIQVRQEALRERIQARQEALRQALQARQTRV